MKNRLLYLLFGFAFFGLLNLNYSSGPGTVTNQGYTGAPGDNNGCTGAGCHADNDNFGSSTTIELKDGSTVVTQYVPGTLYDLKVTINASGAVDSYGFQALCLDSSNDDIAGWETPDSNVKIISFGSPARSYIEHKGGPSSLKSFTSNWRAPAAGTGTVTFYAAGNAVNGSGSSGDDPTETVSLVITEDVSNSIKNNLSLEVALNLFPNPTQDILNLGFEKVQIGEFQLEIVDALGKTMLQQQLNNPHKESIDVANLAAGTYFLRLNDGEKFTTKQFVKN